MLWEIDVFPSKNQTDVHGKSVEQDAADLGIRNIHVKTAYGYLIETESGERNAEKGQIHALAMKLLADPIVENYEVFELTSNSVNSPLSTLHSPLFVLPKPGVTDSVAENAEKIINELLKDKKTQTVVCVKSVKTFKKYWFTGATEEQVKTLATKLLANDAVERVEIGELRIESEQRKSPFSAPRPAISIASIPIREMDGEALRKLSREGQLYLSLTEMQTIQKAFKNLQRDPTDIELETIAQTWSEHCSHKTLAGRIHYVRQNADGTKYERQFQNMLKETIFAATQELCKTNKFVKNYCVSVFSDNAGVVRFDDDWNVCFKVETHNHPSALEPYGGANTGLGGVIRDPMGTGMGAKPIASTDVFCFAPPDKEWKVNAENQETNSQLPPGVLHPKRIMKGVVSGVRDYGNRMGIPTVNGSVYFDERYLGNPLVFCGNIGILPKDKSFKEVKENDFIVAVGGRTGRDGIHGATFSSAELTHESETISGGAVQIGNAITEKMVLDVMLQARDRNLYNAVTDCGAGGFSSAVGEMGEKIGVEVELSNAPLKYEGLSYTEIWISEAQERMVFSVPPEKWDEFRILCDSEDVEAIVLGKFGTFQEQGTKDQEIREREGVAPRLLLKYHGTTVCDLDMKLLHDGRPPVIREANYMQWTESKELRVESKRASIADSEINFQLLKQILSSLNVASKHWIIRQYDHEVQAGSIVKPLVGVNNDGPGDAAVVRPRLDSLRGLVVSNGMNPFYGSLDVYRMAASGIDEAVRNAVAVGADPKTITLLDNFCWGNCDKPETLGSLVEAALACYDVSLGFQMPFISGKDSLNNEFNTGKETIAVPPTLLISAMGQMDDVRNALTMDLKKAGNVLYQLGETKNEFGGSHYKWKVESVNSEVNSQLSTLHSQLNNAVPELNVPQAKKLYERVHEATKHSLLRSVHDLSEGGLAVAVAEMCFAGNLGAELDGDYTVVDLFSESNSRFVVEMEPEQVAAFESHFAGLPFRKLGKVSETRTLRFGKALIANVDELKSAWQAPLNW